MYVCIYIYIYIHAHVYLVCMVLAYINTESFDFRNVLHLGHLKQKSKNMINRNTGRIGACHSARARLLIDTVDTKGPPASMLELKKLMLTLDAEFE